MMMKTLKTKAKREVGVTLVEEVAEGLVYDLACGDHTHRVTVGLDGENPLASLQHCADEHAEAVIKREANKKTLVDAGLPTVTTKAKGGK
ncbi:MAG: hypothetical protein KAR62_03770 [Sphingomonadales bacterium]|nr:hypothetical protein [Sphingomonadales bacterium]